MRKEVIDSSDKNIVTMYIKKVIRFVSFMFLCCFILRFRIDVHYHKKILIDIHKFVCLTISLSTYLFILILEGGSMGVLSGRSGH